MCHELDLIEFAFILSRRWGLEPGAGASRGSPPRLSPAHVVSSPLEGRLPFEARLPRFMTLMLTLTQVQRE